MSNNMVNTKLFSFNGIIGRRDYFLNDVYIQIIGQFFYIPLLIWLMKVTSSVSDFNNIYKYFYESHILFRFYIIAGIALISALTISNIIRRLNDINGKEIPIVNYLISAFFIFCSFSFLLPINNQFYTLLNVIINLFLIFKAGKITSSFPYDYTKEFNWGAFLGGWIWGLFNKSFITLWDLLLFISPFGLYFRLICGLKGNEWAFKNKKWNNVENFNKSQQKQTIFWVIFNIVIIPILYFSLIFAAVFYIFNSKDAQQFITKMETVMIESSKNYFVSYTLSENENKFYVLNKNWRTYTLNDKQNILDIAASIAAYNKNNKYKEENNSNDGLPKKYYYKAEELKITKIYSADNLKLLAEYKEPEFSSETPSFKETVKAAINSYKFYNPD